MSKPKLLWRPDDQAARLAELTARTDDPVKDQPLRRDVRSLGVLLGEVLVEQAGQAVFDAVEDLRKLMIAHREQARAYTEQFIEVYVNVPLKECERRDPKGLYAAARAGALSGLPGADVAYEPPTEPEVIARGGEDTEAVGRILDKLAL